MGMEEVVGVEVDGGAMGEWVMMGVRRAGAGAELLVVG